MFHYSEGIFSPAGLTNWAIGDAVLDWLDTKLPAGGVTLETGAGYSTVLFAAKSVQHIALSFDRDEMTRIAEWCAAKGLSTAHVTHHAGRSQRILPGLDLPALDCVLIDGDHGFPTPLLDWYFTAEHLKLGGFLLNDDTQLGASHTLDRFLEGEAKEGRWTRVATLPNTSVWQRTTSGPVIDLSYAAQPFAREWKVLARAKRQLRDWKRRFLGASKPG